MGIESNHGMGRVEASSLLYQRDEAPIIGVTNGNLHADETIMLMNGMVANKAPSPGDR